MRKIKLAIVGFGRIGKVHYLHLKNNPNYEITHVFDSYDGALEGFSIDSTVKFVKDYNTILEDSEVEAVLICTPTSLHPEMIISAAKAGKHIFCEKPIGLNMEQIKEVYKVVKESDVIFQLGFNRRFDDDFLNIKHNIKKIGTPHILKITSRDPEAPPVEYVKQSGGIFMDMAIHDFDMARYMMGDVVEVFVQGDALINPSIKEYDDVDTAIISLKFANGAIGVIDNSRQAVYGYDQRLEVFGSEGMLANSNHTSTTMVYSSNETIASEKPLHFFLERYEKSYATEMNYFKESILEGKEIACSIEDGILATKIAEAAKESLLTGKSVKVSTDL